jgi:hypothetical protein
MMTVERVGEALTRRIDRRQFLRRSAGAIFGLVAAWAVEGVRTPSALAWHCIHVWSWTCSCSPIGGRYCAQCDPAYSSNCDLTVCDWYYGVHPDTSCWCTATCCYGRDQGYFECCDCDCSKSGGTTCTCSRFVWTGGQPC